MVVRHIRAAVLGVLFGHAAAAWAGEPDRISTREAERRRLAAQVTQDGTFLPYTLTARIGDQRVSSLALGGYDTAQGRGPELSVFVEGALYNRVALRAGVSYLNLRGGQAGALVALRFGVLRQEKQGVDLGVSVGYLNRGLPQPVGEPDGEFQAVVSLGRRWGKLGTFLNLVYDQGIDPKERNAEVRLAALYALGESVNIGLDAKGYYELTDAHERDLENILTDWDLRAGPLVTYSVSHLMLMAQLGGQLQQIRVGGAHLGGGFIATGGVGTSF